MICFRDMSFCSASCATIDCHRQSDEEDDWLECPICKGWVDVKGGTYDRWCTQFSRTAPKAESHCRNMNARQLTIPA